MESKLQKLRQEALEAIESAPSLEALTTVENKFLGRKAGALTEIMKGLKDLSPNEKKTSGELANEVKGAIESMLARKRQDLTSAAWARELENERLDITAPSLPAKAGGHLHPNTLVQRDLERFFSSMGFMVLDGPELESDYYNFTALNIPPNHPARDMQDTFYIKDHGAGSESPWVMRTQTSSVQVRAIQKYGAPLRVVAPGRCFRNEATDVRHEHTFYQLEGFVVDTNISVSHMKGVLEATAQYLYGGETKVRLRPKFYPFVEPGVNGEVTCFLCQGKGCRVCKATGWLEILGAGLIHPNVLRAGGVDPDKYSGFAFGFGLTRLVMLKYGIEDIRHLQGGDLRFLKQF